MSLGVPLWAGDAAATAVPAMESEAQWEADYAAFHEAMMRAIRTGAPQSPAEAEALRAQFLRAHFEAFVQLEIQAMAQRDQSVTAEVSLDPVATAYLETLRGEARAAATAADARWARALLKCSEELQQLEAAVAAALSKPQE